MLKFSHLKELSTDCTGNEGFHKEVERAFRTYYSKSKEVTDKYL